MSISDQILQSEHNKTPLCGGILTINLSALASNYRSLVERAKPAVTSAVVKANAYGLGVENVAPILYNEGCRIFFVAHLVEAFALKPHLPDDVTIAILNGIFPEATATAVEAGFVPVLNSFDAISNFTDLCIKRAQKFPAVIQIDTGMARLGLDEQELEDLKQNPEIFEQADIRFIMSHLSSAEEIVNPCNRQQLERIKQAINALPKTKVAFANSGGLFQGSDFLFDIVRPGIALYGVNPLSYANSEIKPVIELHARVIQTRHVEANTPVGYNGIFITKRKSRITTIAVGYADGLHRTLSNKGCVFINNQEIPMIGRISMDSITLDTTDLEGTDPKAGDLVELIGKNISIEKLAHDMGTIAYEVLTSLGSRYDRRYLK